MHIYVKYSPPLDIFHLSNSFFTAIGIAVLKTYITFVPGNNKGLAP